MEASVCYECHHSFISCVCKSCTKCGTLFMKYFRTKFIKGRSHCRVCSCPVCIACVISIKGYEKVCTRCQLKKKEEIVIAEEAISAVSQAKYGLNVAQTATMTNFKSNEQMKEALFTAAKKGLDHILITLITAGCEVNCQDSNFNTPLHYAAQGGFIAAVALLIEKGADIKTTNNIGWTALHFVASRGASEGHIECTKFLLEMGVDVLAESNIGETAANVAERCNVKVEIIQLLKAVEVEVAMEELGQKGRYLVESSIDPGEKRFGRLISTLLNFVSILTECESNSKSSSNLSSFISDLSGDSKEEACTELDDNDAVIVEKYAYPTIKPVIVEKELFKNVKTFVDRAVSPIEDELQCLMKDTKVNQDLESLLVEKKEWEERCQKLMSTIAESNKDCENTMVEKKSWQEKYQRLMTESATFKIDFQNSLSEKKEWEGRCQKLVDKISLSNNEYKKTIDEKKEWEGRCRNLMTTVANSTKEYKRQMDVLEEDHRIYKSSKEDEIAKYKAAYANKLNKQKQEHDVLISELENRLAECELSRQELFHFQKKMKLTWIPDDLISECQESSCRSLFSAINRKHHCRCCGRVYCLKCSQNKVDLQQLGYTKPARVCNTCHELVNTTFVKEVS